MTTFREILTETERALIDAGVWCGHGYESEHDEAVALVLAAAGLPEDTGTEVLDQIVDSATSERLNRFVALRTLDRLPTAYITGFGWLGPMKFKADSRALVPRSPLMEVIGYQFQPWFQGSFQNGVKRGDEPLSIVDVCCGGGSLGLLAAAQFPEAQVELLDIDEAALSLARENLQLHGLPNAVITQADLLTPLADDSVDVILANPPYVDAHDMATLPPEYLHEPRLALAAGDDGLQLAHRLIVQAAVALREGGVMFMEVGNSWLALERAYPDFAFTWLQFESGGHGVCVLTHDELANLRSRAKCLAGQV